MRKGRRGDERVFSSFFFSFFSFDDNFGVSVLGLGFLFIY